ncbi:MAG: hypothetical protein MMC33_006610 [Icmadophila ericetorum]|nr:hypothetical protein [Icmadophila ericetorum]
MPTEDAAAAKKHKPPTFKPPRPAGKAKEADSTRRKSAKKPAAQTISSSDEAASNDDEDSDSDMVDAEDTSHGSDPPPVIPPELLTWLLQHHFTDKSTKVGKEAKGPIGKYMETFVREALARAAFERSETDGGKSRAEFLEVGFLPLIPTQCTKNILIYSNAMQVEDLEKLAPQLILDF